MSRLIKRCSGAAARVLAVGLAISIPAGQSSAALAEANASPNETTASQGVAVAKRPLLGVKVQSIDKDTADALGLSEPKGALITE